MLSSARGTACALSILENVDTKSDLGYPSTTWPRDSIATRGHANDGIDLDRRDLCAVRCRPKSEPFTPDFPPPSTPKAILHHIHLDVVVLPLQVMPAKHLHHCPTSSDGRPDVGSIDYRKTQMKLSSLESSQDLVCELSHAHLFSDPSNKPCTTPLPPPPWGPFDQHGWHRSQDLKRCQDFQHGTPSGVSSPTAKIVCGQKGKGAERQVEAKRVHLPFGQILRPCSPVRDLGEKAWAPAQRIANQPPDPVHEPLFVLCLCRPAASAGRPKTARVAKIDNPRQRFWQDPQSLAQQPMRIHLARGDPVL